MVFKKWRRAYATSGRLLLQKSLLLAPFHKVVLISHTESGRQKDRTLILEKNQVENVKNSLLSEKLIEEKDIKLKGNKISIHTFIMALLIIIPFYLIFIKKSNEVMAYYNGAIVLFVSTIMIIKIILKLTIPLFNKTTNC